MALPVPRVSVDGTVNVTELVPLRVMPVAATFGAVTLYVAGHVALVGFIMTPKPSPVKALTVTAVTEVPVGPAAGASDVRPAGTAKAALGATNTAKAIAPVVSPAAARRDLDKRMRGPPTVCRPFVDG